MRYLKFLLLFLTLLKAEASAVWVTYDKNRYEIRSVSIDGYHCVGINDIAKIVGADLTYQKEVERVEFLCKTHSLVFFPDNPFVKFDSSFINLPCEVPFFDHQPFLPIQFMNKIFTPVKFSFLWDEEKQELLIQKKISNLKKITIFELYEKTKVKIYLDSPLRFMTDPTKPGKLGLKIYGAVAPEQIPGAEPVGMIEGIEFEQLENAVRLWFTLNKKTRAFRAYLYKDPPIIHLTLSKEVKLEPLRPRRPTVVKTDFGKIRKIVIDPGHGGIDPGAVGPRGYYEKDANLAISKIVKQLLEEKLGVEVIMTRVTDTLIALQQRTEIANENFADLFISIHCNASPKWRRNSRGIETYFLSTAKTDEARAVAARENASIKFDMEETGNIDDVSLILWDLAQNEFLTESSELAEMIQEELVKRLRIPDRGMNQAGFFVLNGAYMPSVLVECAFISHREEERLLRTKRFKQKIAEGIFEGIKRFKEKYETRLSS